MIKLGDRIRLARKINGFTMEDLANKISERTHSKTNKGVISNWENRGVIPREENLSALTDILNLPASFFTERNELGNTLLYYRLERRMSIEELSIKTDLMEEYLSFIEETSEYIHKNDIDTIGKVYGIADFLNHLLENERIMLLKSINDIKDQVWDEKFNSTAFQRLYKKYDEAKKLDFASELTRLANVMVNQNYTDHAFYQHLVKDKNWLNDKMNNIRSLIKKTDDVDLLSALRYSENLYWDGKLLNSNERMEIRHKLSLLLDGGKNSFETLPAIWGDPDYEEVINHLLEHNPRLIKEEE